jgi:hypothetical protein
MRLGKTIFFKGCKTNELPHKIIEARSFPNKLVNEKCTNLQSSPVDEATNAGFSSEGSSLK